MSREGRKRFDETVVLERAMNQFWQQGYHASGLTSLLKAMGISRQSMYDTFGNKRDLFARCIEHYKAVHLSRALLLLEECSSPLQGVRAVVSFFEALAIDARCRGCFVANAIVEVGNSDPGLAKVLADTLATLETRIEDNLVRAIAAGELPREPSARVRARTVTNALIGMAVTGKLESHHERLGDIHAGTLAALA